MGKLIKCILAAVLFVGMFGGACGSFYVGMFWKPVPYELVDDEGNIYEISDNVYFVDDHNDRKYDPNAILLTKFDKDKKLLWSRKFYGPNRRWIGLRATCVDKNQNIFIVGRTSLDNKENCDLPVVMKFGPTGNKLWQVYYTQGKSSDLLFGFMINQAVVDEQGCLYITGEHDAEVPSIIDPDHTDTISYSLTLKYDTDGKLISENRYPEKEREKVSNFNFSNSSITINKKGQIYVAGDFMEYTEKEHYGCIVLIKYDPSGEILWKNNYLRSSNYFGFPQLQFDRTGNFYISTDSRNYENKWSGQVVIKCDSDGKQQWVTKYGQTGKKKVSHAGTRFDSIGNIYIVGDISTPEYISGNIGTLHYFPAPLHGRVCYYQI